MPDTQGVGGSRPPVPIIFSPQINKLNFQILAVGAIFLIFQPLYNLGNKSTDDLRNMVSKNLLNH